jgi:plastocyanin
MRAVSIFLALAMVMAGALAFLPRSAVALETPKLTITVEAFDDAEAYVFRPGTIVLPQVPIILNVTLFNNGTTLHTFTIDDSSGNHIVDLTVSAHGDRATTEFTVTSATQITVGAQTFTADTSTAGGIQFYCVPHLALNMVGNLVVGGVSAPESPEIGVFLRAYWIGLIGLAAMLVWTGITYFIIKGSSRHLRDHHDHIRKGLP